MLQGWDAFKTFGLGWPNSKALGLTRLKTPKVQEPEELETDFNADAYLKQLASKNGYEKSIIAGRKKPKLGTQTMLG